MNETYQQTMSMLDCPISDNLNFATNVIVQSPSSDCVKATNYSCWDYWQHYYYPEIIHSSYPVYIQERAYDKGKQAFEIIKMLQDKKIIKLEKVSNFIDCMDTLIKIL